MHGHVALVVAGALALSACAPTAQGAFDVNVPLPAPSVAPLIVASPAATPTATPGASVAPPPSPPPSPPAAAAGSPSPSPSPSPSSTRSADPTILGGPAPVGSFVLGDSISLSAGVGPVLGRYGYRVVGLVGQSVSDAYLTEHLSSAAAQLAPSWVIELGTNNRGDGGDVARLAGWVDLIDGLRTPGQRQRVRWVTPYRPADHAGAPQESELDAFNGELARLAGERRWLRILDFATLAKANPEWFDEDAALHVHPDAAGQAALVALVAGTDPVPAAVPLLPSNAAQAPEESPTPDPAFDNDELDEVFDNNLP